MTKGFGTPRNYEREKRQLMKAIEQRNLNLLGSLREKFKCHMGHNRLQQLLVDEVLVEVSVEAADWFWQSILSPKQYQQMKEMACQAMLDTLIDDGCELGKDISSVEMEGSSQFLLSNKARETLLSYVPNKHQKQLAEMFKDHEPEHPATMLEKHLGVDFFAKLLVQAKKRLPTLTDRQAVRYLLTIAAGVGERHPEIREFPRWFLVNATAELTEARRQQLWELIESEAEFENCSHWLEDLLIAAGGSRYVHTHPDNPEDNLIDREGMLLLDQVYQGERRSSELVAALDAHMKGRGLST